MMPKCVLRFLLLMSVGCWACLPGKSVVGGDKNSVITLNQPRRDTLRFEPDPFSGLVELETRFGVMKVELFFHTGEHRENFVRLIEQGFYDSLLFHRVIKNFMIQGGDPQSRRAQPGARLGGGGNGKELSAQINTEFFHVCGALAAARQSDEVNPQKKSSGCQFYIVQGSPVQPDQLDRNERKYGFAYSKQQRELYALLGGAPQLDMEYTVFGRVYEGLHLIDSIAAQPTDSNDRPQEDLRMKWRIVRR